MCRAGGVAGAASVLLVLAWTGVGADLYHEYGGVKLPHYDYEAAGEGGREGDGQGEAAGQYRDPDDYAKHGERRSPAPQPTPAPHEPPARAQARQPRRRELDDAPDNQTLDDKYSNEDVPKLKSKSKQRRSKELRDISEELTRALEGGPRIETEEGRRRGRWGGADESDVEYALPPSGEEHYPHGLEESGLDTLGVGGAPVGGAGAPVDGRAPLPADGPTDNYDSYDMKRVYKLKDKLPPLLRRTTQAVSSEATSGAERELAALLAAHRQRRAEPATLLAPPLAPSLAPPLAPPPVPRALALPPGAVEPQLEDQWALFVIANSCHKDFSVALTPFLPLLYFLQRYRSMFYLKSAAV